MDFVLPDGKCFFRTCDKERDKVIFQMVRQDLPPPSLLSVSLNLLPRLLLSVALCITKVGEEPGDKASFCSVDEVVVSSPRELRMQKELSEQPKWCKIYLIFHPLEVKIICLCREEDVAGIDVNMGCPKEFSLKVQQGDSMCPRSSL